MSTTKKVGMLLAAIYCCIGVCEIHAIIMVCGNSSIIEVYPEEQKKIRNNSGPISRSFLERRAGAVLHYLIVFYIMHAHPNNLLYHRVEEHGTPQNLVKAGQRRNEEHENPHRFNGFYTKS